MKPQVDMAVLNNAIWCGLVCDTHGIAQTSREHVWGLLSEAPAFYPDIITVSRVVTTEEVMDFIGSREISSIKDSYANLDMLAVGFNILFEAEWIYHATVVDMDNIQTPWRVITTEEELSQWTFASGLEGVIKSDLLQHKDVKIFIHENNGEISGFIANLGADVVGISNVFSAVHTNESLWIDIVRIVSTEFPGLPMVGYEQNGDLAAALSSGWTSIGPLRVWIKGNH